MKFAVNELMKSARRALSALYTKFLNVGGMDYDVFCKLYESLVEPVLLNGAGLRGLSKTEKGIYAAKQSVPIFFGPW